MSSNSKSKTSNNRPTPANEHFTSGGDITLQSIDKIDFSVHSVILSMASGVFADMFDVGNDSKSQQTVVLPETAQIIAIMLQFIYPLPPPDIPSFEILNQVLHVADKYQLQGMTAYVRERMDILLSPVNLWKSPAHTLSIAVRHGLQWEIEQATSKVQNRYNLCTTKDLLTLAKMIPAATPWIKLIGTQAAKQNILVDVLFSFHQEPMRLSTSQSYHALLCAPCKDIHSSGIRHSPPEWQARWAYWVSKELQTRTQDNWDECFTVPFLYSTAHRGADIPIRAGLKNNCTCLDVIYQAQSTFLKWTCGVHDVLKARLGELDKLSALKESS
ncbi:hypothetical protein CTheo_4406 [Ceratobasidium theobromae]|uniref:BTB domain-containing protein n=1 Tax=Ceratobasidium theobromae TaxID=1582974 RepID=A0A5N5QKY8_9AGAM|nr:hypothetical protein CTheo_4406 [Ceratobasidium theobromae]